MLLQKYCYFKLDVEKTFLSLPVNIFFVIVVCYLVSWYQTGIKSPL